MEMVYIGYCCLNGSHKGGGNMNKKYLQFKKALSILISFILVSSMAFPLPVFAAAELPELLLAEVVDNGAAVDLTFDKDMAASENGTAGSYNLAMTVAGSVYASDSGYGDGNSMAWVKTLAADGAIGWNYRAPLPSANIVNNVEYANGRYMAVGYNGTLVTSSDGVSWDKVDVGSDTDRFSGIAYGNGKYVIVGSNDSNGYAARIFTSDDGAAWHETASIANHSLNDVVYGDGQFVAVGEYGKIIISNDGETWETITVDPMDYTLQSVTYANGKYVAAGMRKHTGISNRGAIMTSVNGVEWTVAYTNTTYTLWDVTYGEGVLVAVGGQSDQSNGNLYICYSTNDGESWTAANVSGAPTSKATFFSVEYDGSRFIAVGNRTTSPYDAYVATSDNGTAWTYVNTGTLPQLTTVTSNDDGSLYVAMGGPGDIYTSDNGGLNRTRRTRGATKSLSDVAWDGNGLFVSVGVEGTIQTSSDGVNWTIQNSNTSNNLNRVDYLNGLFIAVGKNGTIVTSSNGTEWVAQTSGTGSDLNGVAYGSGKYIVAGGNDYPVVLASDDGITWNTVTDSDFYNRPFVAVAYGNGEFLALTQYGQALRSGDGIDWTQAASIPGSAKYPTDMIYADGKFVGVGGYGEIYLSSDNGTSWSVVDTDLDTYSYSIAYGGGNFIAVGVTGKIIASSDGGTTWYVQPSGLSTNPYFSLSNNALLSGITAGDSTFIAVGVDGLTIQSESLAISTDTDVHNVALTRMGSTFSSLYYSGMYSSITGNITLPSNGVNGTSISWSSSKPEYISPDGTVTRPAFGAGDQVVYLTATITSGAAGRWLIGRMY